MKQLKFDHDNAEAITSGSRRKTVRVDDKNIHVGDRIQIVDKVSSNKPQQWMIPGEIKVTGIQEFSLGNMPEEVLDSSELKNTDNESLFNFLRRFYGEDVDENTLVKVISFDYEAYKSAVPFMTKVELQDDRLESAVLYADGGSRGNPGPSAAGFVILDKEGKLLESWNKYLGITTNNQAEYHALVAGMEWCKQKNVKDLQIRMDSLLVVNQMKGIFKVKNRDLWSLSESAKNLQSQFNSTTITHVPREMNKLADAEVNKALDAIKDKDVLQ